MKTIDEQDAEITDLRAQLAARDATIKLAKEALEKAVSVIGECPKAQRGAGGMTVDAMLARTVFNGVPFSVYEELSEALAALDAAAVEKLDHQELASIYEKRASDMAYLAAEVLPDLIDAADTWWASDVEGREETLTKARMLLRMATVADAPESAGEEG